MPQNHPQHPTLQQPEALRFRAAHNDRGFTLVELMIVVAVMGIVTAVVLPHLAPSVAGQLEAAGGIVVADLDYARQLAVANQSTYTVDFASTGASYTIEHSGTNSSLNALPNSPFRRPGEPDNQHTSRFADLPQAGLQVQFLTLDPPPADSNPNLLEFGELGNLTSGVNSTVWLAGGQGRDRFYLPVIINSATGLATLGEMTSVNPLAAQSEAVASGSSVP